MTKLARLFCCPECNGAGEWDEGPKWGGHAYAEPIYDQVICPVCKGAGSVNAKTFIANFEGDDEDPELLAAIAEDAWENDLQRLSERLEQLNRMRQACDAPGGYSDECPF